MFENFIPAHSLEDENRLAEIQDVLPERNQAIPWTNTNKHPCKHTCTWSSWQAPCPIAVFCSKSKQIYSCMYSVHCLVNSICWCSCFCLTFVMFQPSYCNFFFLFLLPASISYRLFGQGSIMACIKSVFNKLETWTWPTKGRWKRFRARHNVQFLKDSSVTLPSELTD